MFIVYLYISAAIVAITTAVVLLRRYYWPSSTTGKIEPLKPWPDPPILNKIISETSRRKVTNREKQRSTTR